MNKSHLSEDELRSVIDLIKMDRPAALSAGLPISKLLKYLEFAFIILQKWNQLFGGKGWIAVVIKAVAFVKFIKKIFKISK